MTPPRPRSRWRLPVVLYAHPLELAVGIALTMAGLHSLETASSAPDALEAAGPHPLVVLAWQLGSIAGGLGLVVGLAGRERAFFRAVERASCFVVAAVAVALALAVGLDAGDDAGYAIGQLAAIAVGLLLRARAIHKTERVILEQLRAANRDQDHRDAIRQLVDGRPPREAGNAP